MTQTHVLAAAAFVFGACFGSFLNVCNYRLPLGISLVTPPSSCPRCQAPISAYLNVPILGWFLAMGKCCKCRQPISPHYFMVEALVGALFLALFYFTGNLIGACLLGVFVSMLLTAIVMDLKYFGMPGQLLYAASIVVALTAWLCPQILNPRVIHYEHPVLMMTLAGGATFWFILFAIKKVSQLFYREYGPVVDKTFTVNQEGIAVTDAEGTELSKWEELPDSYIIFKNVILTVGDQDKRYQKVIVRQTETTTPDGNLLYEQPITIKAEEIVRIRDTMGEGDLILSPALGALIGLNWGILEMIILGCTTAAIHGFILKRKDRQLPFGPHLILSSFYVYLSLQGLVPRIWSLFQVAAR